MGLLDRIFGRHESTAKHAGSIPAPPGSGVVSAPPGAPGADDQALARYHYLLRTAPPEALEQVHAEAFARLTPQQRAQVLRQMAAAVPASERGALDAGHNDPQTLARVATRAELRQPGFLERTLGAGGMGFGTSLLGSFLASMAGSMLAQQLMSGFHGFGESGWGNDQPSELAQAADEQAAEGNNAQDDFVEEPDADYDPGNLGDAGDLGDGFNDDFGGDFDV